jgi:hypothetical protein
MDSRKKKKKMYKIFQVLLEKICYKYADLNVIVMLTVLQGRETKFCCV